MNLILQIVTSDLVSNEILEASGQLLTAYAALNRWLEASGNKRPDFERVTKISVEVSFVARDVYTAWVAFRDAFAPTRQAEVGNDERQTLILTIRQAASRLDELRHSVD